MKNYIKILALSFATLFMVSSCIKDDTAVLGDEGNTIIKISESGTKALFFSPFLEVKKVDLVDVRRDANSSANLQSVISVVLEDAPDLVDQYNADNGTDFKYLPSDIYTLVADGGVSYINGKYTLNFGAGDFAKNISINLDGSKWDLSKKYAIGFRLTDNGAATLSAEKSEVVVTISVKNKYDGTYLLTGYHTRAPYNFPYETEVELRTFGANSLICYWPDAGSFGHPIGVGPDNALSWYGPAVSPIFVIDLDTELITEAYNNSTAVVIDKFDEPGLTNGNYYDADTKTFYISWRYSGNNARAFIDKYEYLGPR